MSEATHALLLQRIEAIERQNDEEAKEKFKEFKKSKKADKRNDTIAKMSQLTLDKDPWKTLRSLKKGNTPQTYSRKRKRGEHIRMTEIAEEAGQHLAENQWGKPEQESGYDIIVNVSGGGLSGQSGAIRLGISRALISANLDYRSILKSNGLLTRDARKVERKKPGQPGARKKFQFSKR